MRLSSESAICLAVPAGSGEEVPCSGGSPSTAGVRRCHPDLVSPVSKKGDARKNACRTGTIYAMYLRPLTLRDTQVTKVDAQKNWDCCTLSLGEHRYTDRRHDCDLCVGPVALHGLIEHGRRRRLPWGLFHPRGAVGGGASIVTTFTRLLSARRRPERVADPARPEFARAHASKKDRSAFSWFSADGGTISVASVHQGEPRANARIPGRALPF